MSSITTINSTDLPTNSRSTINTNFSNLNTDKMETSVLDTDNTLAANSDLKVASQKAVKAYVDAGGNVNASTTAKGIVEEATAAEVAAFTAAGGTNARLFVNPSSLPSILKFGGTGADGALAISSGITTIDLVGAQVVVKNYTSISITGTGSLAFSNPHANGTIVILKSQGVVTLTSSTAPMIDMSGIGAAAGAGTSIGASTTGDGAAGSDGYGLAIFKTGQGGGGAAASAGTAGATPTTSFLTQIIKQYSEKYPAICPGAGGGGGGCNTGGGSTATSGNGGRGGGALIIECGGAWNFTTASGISVAGKVGTAGSITGGAAGAGGGGGGGAGVFYAFYNSLTANSGTITISGGAGGGSNEAGGVSAGSGGGSGGSAAAVGVVGTRSAAAGANNASGGTGATGFSLVAANTDYT